MWKSASTTLKQSVPGNNGTGTEAPNERDVRIKRTIQKKCVVLGDGACGKTSLLTVFVRGEFPYHYEPTVFENYVQDIRRGDTLVELSLWDTAGQEDFARLRSLTYPDTNCIMLCFSVDSPTSIENVETKWLEEILHYCEGVRICLCALKCDLREDARTIQDLARTDEKPVTYETGLAVAKRIRASRYLETSAKTNRGVVEAFEEVASVAISGPRKKPPQDKDTTSSSCFGCFGM